MWTPDIFTHAKLLADTRHSASRIASILNDLYGTQFTRNAVIGKLNRNKITLQGSGSGCAATNRPKRPARPPRPPREPAPVILSHPNPTHPNGLPFSQTTASMCMYVLPNGNRCSDPLHMRSFCTFHYYRCYALAKSTT
jgi:hypothetical protein